MTSPPATPSPESLRRYTPDLRSVAEIRLVTLENGPGRGQRLLIARNAAGLAFEVAVDRAFDLCALTYRGINLGWRSPTQLPASPFPHDLDDGLGILRNFDGLIVTCGLDHYGEPAEGPAQHFIYPIRRRIQYPLHGRISAQAATLIGYGLDESAAATLWCEGEVRQAAVFGEVLVLRRRIELDLFGRQIRQSDVVLNQGFRPTRHGLLYHINLGYPLLDRDVELIGGFGRLKETFRSAPPVPDDHAEELFDQIEPEADGEGMVMVGMRNPTLLAGVSLRVRFSKAQLPQVGLWRCWQSGLYAMGIEPCSGLDPGALVYNGKGTPHFLEPGARRRYELTLEVAEDS
jgi:Domain of unknown function (DUF4432)